MSSKCSNTFIGIQRWKVDRKRVPNFVVENANGSTWSKVGDSSHPMMVHKMYSCTRFVLTTEYTLFRFYFFQVCVRICVSVEFSTCVSVFVIFSSNSLNLSSWSVYYKCNCGNKVEHRNINKRLNFNYILHFNKPKTRFNSAWRQRIELRNYSMIK